MSVFDLAFDNSKYTHFYLLELHHLMETVKASIDVEWDSVEYPSLWNYTDEEYDKDGNWILSESTNKRVLLANQNDMETLFGNCR